MYGIFKIRKRSSFNKCNNIQGVPLKKIKLMFICLLSNRNLIIFLILSDDSEKTLQLLNLMCTDNSKNNESSHRSKYNHKPCTYVGLPINN